MKPTVDEQELAYKIATKLDEMEYRQKIGSQATKLRIIGMYGIVVQEIMEFRGKQVPVAKSEEEEHF